MSLYYESAALLSNTERIGGSLRSRVYGKRDLKNAPAQVFALAAEATKWSPFLKPVIEHAEVLKQERKLTPVLALLLTYDLLFSKNGVAAPANHPLRLAISRHKARLQAEVSRARLKLGLSSLAALKTHVDASQDVGSDGDTHSRHHRHPRWVRVNTLKSTRPKVLAGLKEELTEAFLLRDVSQSGASKSYHVDATIPDLIAFPPNYDVSVLEAYKIGQLIVQDKASCFPATLLCPAVVDGDIIDATAAPGNKTTHLAALSKAAGPSSNGKVRKVIAYERNAMRFQTLQKMVRTAGADVLTDVLHQDFLSTDPQANDMRNVRAILLDPSCSGSGIIGRDDEAKLVLPETPIDVRFQPANKKRKRGDAAAVAPAPASPTEATTDEEAPMTTDSDQAALEARLEALSTFQLKILLHAMSFPNCNRITYSTCSTHFIENENVVLRALNHATAADTGWRILKRADQPSGLRDWHLRGDTTQCMDTVVADACIRCEKGTADGTMGFFVAGFVRDLPLPLTHRESGSLTNVQNEENDDEWEGFED